MSSILSAFGRRVSTEAERTTGFIEAEANEKLLFFDNVYPLQLGFWDLRYWLIRLDKNSVNRVVEKVLPPELDASVKEIIPRFKEGGAFIRLTLPAEETARSEVMSKIQANLATHQPTQWFNPLQSLRVFEVQGRPFVEDLARFPSSRLRVEFEGPDLPQETLYSLFRKFGKIRNIFPQSPSSKDLPRFAIIQFHRLRSGSAARNCLHGLKWEGTRIHILFERTERAHTIRDWLTSHPRFTVPAAAALIAAITVAIFDPVRTWFIEQKVGRTFHLSDNRFIQWIKTKTYDLVSFHKSSRPNHHSIWENRDGHVTQLHQWLAETGDQSFIVLQGPRGSGKRDLLLNRVLLNRKELLLLDCEQLTETKQDSKMIAALADQVGYFPLFGWVNSMSSMMDLAAQGLIGSSAGFSETLEAQVKKILNSTAAALRSRALKGKPREVRDEDWLQLHPEQRPVVVLDSFLHKGEESTQLYANISTWAAALVENNIAHVVFLTSNLSFTQVLTKALPTRSLRTITLGDASPEAAREYIRKRLEDDPVFKEEAQGLELDRCIDILGGRLQDMDLLAQRLRIGEWPEQAIDALIEASVGDIIKKFLVNDTDEKAAWSSLQAWTHAQTDTGAWQVSYQKLLLDPIIKGDEEALKALEQAEFIIIGKKLGRPSVVKIGRPVYRAAFAKLCSDNATVARMQLKRATLLAQKSSDEIQVIEKELGVLKDIAAAQTMDRVRYLLDKLKAAHEEVTKIEREQTMLKEVLKKAI
ncbi:RNA12 protein-domain-containing protein [Protomyces lactucae-debilis]|uniref:Mitochondrial escape protein 2 n=1 Tax=Protomyces lactucae-debilis TaxID=2754530 RepID=A0A1Y2FVR2_PROLT|nr:RNA12 protein-domain-containing protein [Protomyces lactucae-debilis]ORY87647.1 RNA12 protein-domain-containing protein [Protomyces lactucae-debilis]